MTVSKRLEEVTEFVMDGTHGSPVRSEAGIPVLSAQNVAGGRLSWKTDRYTSQAEFEAFDRRLSLQPKDVLLTIVGSIGRSAILEEAKPLVFQRSVAVLRPKRNELDSSYLRHAIESADFQEQLRRATNQSSQAGVYLGKLKRLTVVVPPIEEQRRIAAILDQAEALRAKRRQALAKLDTLTQSLFLEMFGNPALNHKGWPPRRFGDLAVKFSDGPFGSNLKSEHYVKEGVRVIRLQNIGVGEFLDFDRAYISRHHAEDLSKHQCLAGDVLVGTLGDPNLRACIQPAWLDVAINKADCVQIRPDPKQATAEWIIGLLNNPTTEQMAGGLILGQTRSRIAMGRLRELQVPVPPLDLQVRYARVCRNVALEKGKFIVNAVLQDKLFTSFQHRAFRGEL